MLFIAKVNSLLVMWSPGRVPTGNWDWVGRRAGEEFMVGLDTSLHSSLLHIASTLTSGLKLSLLELTLTDPGTSWTLFLFRGTGSLLKGVVSGAQTGAAAE